jgi:hypothetical protein
VLRLPIAASLPSPRFNAGAALSVVMLEHRAAAQVNATHVPIEPRVRKGIARLKLTGALSTLAFRTASSTGEGIQPLVWLSDWLVQGLPATPFRVIPQQRSLKRDGELCWAAIMRAGGVALISPLFRVGLIAVGILSVWLYLEQREGSATGSNSGGDASARGGREPPAQSAVVTPVPPRRPPQVRAPPPRAAATPELPPLDARSTPPPPPGPFR